MKVEQFYNRNQFHLYNGGVDILQSYDSTVVKVEKDYHNKTKYITLGCNWDYSNTTRKHVYLFLEEYGDISFYGITNKMAYVNKLISEGKITYNEVLK